MVLELVQRWPTELDPAISFFQILLQCYSNSWDLSGVSVTDETGNCEYHGEAG